MDYQLFSSDDHIDLKYLPSDLWQSRVPTALRARAPRVEEAPQGRRWMADGTPFSGILGLVPKKQVGASAGRMLGASGDHAFGLRGVIVEQEYDKWRPTQPSLRLQDMDRDGVEGHVLYGPFMAFQLSDPALNVACMSAYNDWAAEFTKVNPRRLVGIGVLPVHDAAAAVAEVKRCAKLGLKGVQFHAFASYKFHWDEVWEPLWAAAAEADVSISFHIGGGHWSCPTNLYGETFFGPPGRGVHATNLVTIAARLDEILVSLILAGVLKRHKNLRVVMAECSIGWIPFVLERMDRQHNDRHGSGRDDSSDLEMAPSGYYRRQMRVTFEKDPVGMRLLDLLGPETVMWGSDYPHAAGTWPDSHATVEKLFAGMDPKVTRMLVRDNCRDFYA